MGTTTQEQFFKAYNQKYQTTYEASLENGYSGGPHYAQRTDPSKEFQFWDSSMKFNETDPVFTWPYSSPSTRNTVFATAAWEPAASDLTWYGVINNYLTIQDVTEVRITTSYLFKCRYKIKATS